MSAPRKICPGGAGECCASCRFYVGRLADSEPIGPDMQWITPDTRDGGGCETWQGTDSRISDWRCA